MPRYIDDGHFKVEPTSQGGVEIRSVDCYCHIPRGQKADAFWQAMEVLDDVSSAYDFASYDDRYMDA